MQKWAVINQGQIFANETLSSIYLEVFVVLLQPLGYTIL